MKFDRIPNAAEPDFLPVPQRARPRLHLVPLAEDLVAAFFDASGQDAVSTSQLAAWSGDEALCLPLLGSRLTRLDGGLRYVFFLARSSRDLCRNGLWITRDDRPLAEIDPSALQSPVVDALALIVGLAPEGEQRLLRLLLTTGQSLFGDRAFAGIRDMVVQLLERLSPPPLALRAWCPLGETAAVASYALPSTFTPRDVTTMVSIGPDGAHRIAGVSAEVEEGTGGQTERLLHVYLPGGVAYDTTLVVLSDAPLRLAGPTKDTRQRPLGAWLSNRSTAVRRNAGNRLKEMASSDRTAAALLAEISCPDAALPQVVPHLVSRTSAGVFYVLGVSDPRRLLAKLVLRSEDGDTLLPLRAPLHHPRLGALQVGFASANGAAAPGDTAELYALFRSGRMTRIDNVVYASGPTAMPALLDDLPARAVAPALAAALADAVQHRPAPRGEAIVVAAPTMPAVTTVIVELGASLDYVFALAATLAGRDDVVLMIHHADRRALAALRTLGEELHAIYGIGVTLLDFSQEDVLASERSRAAVVLAETDVAICLSGDVLPEHRGWLDAWTSALTGDAPLLAGAVVTGHDAGADEEDDAAPGADAVPRIDGRAFGVNAAARAVFETTPLRVGSREADIADLAATLGAVADACVTRVAFNRMTSHTRPPERPRAIDLAERLTLQGVTTL